MSVVVPLWFLKIVTGAAFSGLLAGIGGLFLLVRNVDSLRQMLIGADGRNGLRGDLRHLNRRHEELTAEVQDQGKAVGRMDERVTDVRSRVVGLEERERERGIAA